MVARTLTDKDNNRSGFAERAAMDLDLTSSIVALKRNETIGKVQTAVARKILDMQQFQGSAAVKLIEAATRGVQEAGDSLVAAATGLGGAIDTYG